MDRFLVPTLRSLFAAPVVVVIHKFPVLFKPLWTRGWWSNGPSNKLFHDRDRFGGTGSVSFRALMSSRRYIPFISDRVDSIELEFIGHRGQLSRVSLVGDRFKLRVAADRAN